jgi:pimeloyl-ACP methyl ester carboxylesterase
METSSAQKLVTTEGSIAYEVLGRGPLVVCLPGLGDVREQYRKLAPSLAAAGFRVATADLRGHGECSAQWPSYGPEDTGRDLLALIEQLDSGPAIVLANSFAAASAVWAAAQSPSAVAGLVLIGPFVRDLPSSALQRGLIQLLFARPWGPSAWGGYYASLYPTRKPDDLPAYRAALVGSLRRPGYLEATRAMIKASKAGCEARLAEVKVPTLVVMGEKDPDFKAPQAEAELIAQRLHAEVLLVPEAGHYPHVEFPERVTEPVLRFLRGVSNVQPS